MRNNLIYAFLFMLVFSSCATKTKVESKWRDEKYDDKKYSNIAVFAVFKSIPDNATFEKKVVAKATGMGLKVTPSFAILQPDTAYKKEDVVNALALNKSDLVVIFKLIGTQKDKTYNPPTTSYYPNYYAYGPSVGYYDYWYPAYRTTTSAGYWSETAYYILEVMMFDVKDEKLIWSAKTKTTDPTNLTDMAESVLHSVLKELKSEGRMKK